MKLEDPPPPLKFALLTLFRNQFVMEYCGEVMNYKDFQERAEHYDRENKSHYS